MEICEKYKNALENYTEENILPNIFEKINMRENSHSEILKWLLDVKDKVEDSIQYSFIKDFITFIVKKGYINIDNIDNFIKNLKTDINIPKRNTCKFEKKFLNCKYIDILLKSEKAKFVCVIENKLDATINTDEKGKTQLEYYYEYIEKENEYKDYQKLFILLSPKIGELKEENVKRICRKEFVTCIKYNNNKFKKFGDYIDALGVYKTIEYSDIVLFIYNFLKDKKINCKDIKEYQKFFKAINKNYEKENKNKEILKNLIQKPFDSFHKPRRFDVPMREIMEKKYEKEDIDFIYFVLKQYTEYWEYKSKFIGGGYTKIIDIAGEQSKYLWSILENVIKKDEEYWNSLKKDKVNNKNLISIMKQIEKQEKIKNNYFKTYVTK